VCIERGRTRTHAFTVKTNAARVRRGHANVTSERYSFGCSNFLRTRDDVFPNVFTLHASSRLVSRVVVYHRATIANDFSDRRDRRWHHERIGEYAKREVGGTQTIGRFNDSQSVLTNEHTWSFDRMNIVYAIRVQGMDNVFL